MTVFKRLFRWQRGRQESGYDKMLLCTSVWPLKFDTYLLKFPQNSLIEPHVDKVAAGKHYRLNIVLKEAAQGGVFVCQHPLFETRRIKLFRPDIAEHSVTRIEKGNRYVLSVGWVLSNG